jgi:hypothetical protein
MCHHISEGSILQDLIVILDITIGGFQYTCELMKHHGMVGEITANGPNYWMTENGHYACCHNTN